MSTIKVQLNDDITGDLEELEFDTAQTIEEVIGGYMKRKQIEDDMESGAIVCEIGNRHEKLILHKAMSHKLSKYIKNNELLVLKSFSRKFGLEAFKMTDPTKGSCQRGFSKTAPKWRVIHRGLNVFGLCKNPKCEATGKTVIIRKDNQTVDFGDDQFQFLCPLCGCPTKPKTVAFYMCKYKLYGTKVEGREIQDFGPIEGDAHDRYHHTYYDPEVNHDATFIKYVVEVPHMYDK